MDVLSIPSAENSSGCAVVLNGNGHTTPKGRAKDRTAKELYCSGEVRILVLDDDLSICRVIQAALATKDFTVDAVSDPTLMEAQLRDGIYHIVILDYVIP